MGFELLWIVLVACAVLCAVGFYKFVYFLSIGYGFAVAGGAIVIGVLFWDSLLPVHFFLLALFVAYGARLSGFLLVRELKNAAYRKTLDEATKVEKPMPIFVLAFIWIFCSVLYTAQLSPVFYRLYNGNTDQILPLIGGVISLAGLIIEAVSDKQKSAQKAVDPNMVATQGLYRIVRCPNYLGEITFWTGMTIGALNALTTAGQWIMAILAWIAIVYIMFNGAQRLEKRQTGRYGDNPAYQAYVAKTPIILPFVPLYTLAGKKKEK